MRHYTLADIGQRRAQAGELYQEFLHVPAMSAGLYELAVGAEDPQEPHTEDELYYVVAGRAALRLAQMRLRSRLARWSTSRRMSSSLPRHQRGVERAGVLRARRV